MSAKNIVLSRNFIEEINYVKFNKKKLTLHYKHIQNTV